MAAAALPANETLRLRLLDRHRILDTPQEPAFDDLARLAAVICHAPMATIPLVDSGRQWFKARIGLADPETSREHSFCAHAILEDKMMVVEDATTDSRFSENPLVIGAPHIRFYAGAPLLMEEGVSLGTLCVLDRKPRQLTSTQTEALHVLRRAVITQMELRRALLDLADVEKLLPMCAWCRDVRTGANAWAPLYEYVMKSGQVTHGICPSCVAKFGPPNAPA